jgi:mannobiose 2-epimerase
MTPLRPYLTVSLILLAGSRPEQVDAAPPRNEDARRLHEKIDGLLRAELTGRWYPHALDRALGGFHQGFARDWTATPDENRFLVYQARMTWTAAAFAAYSPPHRNEYVRYARSGIEYLDRVMRDPEFGGFHWVLDPNGHVDPRLGDEKHVYGTAFVLYAASEVYDVTYDDLALKVARDAFAWLEGHAHDAEHGGYFEAITRQGKPILVWDEDAPLAKRTDRLGTYYGFKSMNAHIHLLEALTAFSKVENTPPVMQRLREVHSLVRDRVAAEPGALNLYLTRDWQATPAHDSFGHDIETAFLLVEAAEALGVPDDPKTWHIARRLVDHALDWGWDGEHGGFYHKGEAFGGGAFDQHKDWWTQAEGLNALLLMHRKFGAKTERYWESFLKEWGFIEAHLLDPDHGGWYSETKRDGTLIGDGRKSSQWKANYHTARALMNVSEMLGSKEGRALPGALPSGAKGEAEQSSGPRARPLTPIPR